MITEETVERIFAEFANVGDAIFVKSTDSASSFAEVVEDYRRAEAEFVSRMGGNQFGVLEIKRRIAESILWAAQRFHPPFEACRDAWNDLVHVGFTHIERECTMTRFYAECCAYDEKPEEGLAVLEPLLAELERERDHARATQRRTAFYDDNLERLRNLRNALEAQKRGELVPWLETRREDEAAPPMTPEEEQADALYDEFSHAKHAVFKTYGKSLDRSFADVAGDYRRVEAEFVARAGEGEAFEACVLDMKARTAEAILRAACELHASFQDCRDAWDEFVRVGQDKSWMYPEMYVETCLANDEPEAGLAVVVPWIAEIERKLEACKEPLRPPGETSVELERKLKELHELRDKLIALRKRP